MRGPLTGAFQMAVWTVLPCQLTSRGRPTLTDSKRAITLLPTMITAGRDLNRKRYGFVLSHSRQCGRRSCIFAAPARGCDAASPKSPLK
jgi:hypothetical protein